jgi:hypothetical protein
MAGDCARLWGDIMNLKAVLACASLLLAGGTAFSSQASTLVLNSTAEGWINQFGVNNGLYTFSDYLAGNCNINDCTAEGGGEFRNFFQFNVPTLGKHVASAVLQLRTETIILDQAPSLTYQVTSTSALTFADLGAGTVYGSHTYGASDQGTVRDITLNSAALSAIGTGGGLFTISGRVTSPTTFGPNAPEQLVFGSSIYPEQLILTTAVPEPATWAVMLAGLSGLGAVVRRRRARTPA